MSPEPIVDARVQFGREAEKYLSSPSHGNEAQLRRFIEVAKPQGGTVLDVATGAGHTAFALATVCEKVIASDITPEMLAIVERESKNRQLSNIEALLAPAEEIPLPDQSLDGVACRVAPHHFRDVSKFLAEVHRILKPGGWFGLVDTIGIDDPEADQELQQIETERDPSHVRDYTVEEWLRMIDQAGLRTEFHEESSFPHNAYDWLDRMSVSEPTRSRLLNQITYSSKWLKEYLRPTGEGETLTFRLHQILLRAVKPSN